MRQQVSERAPRLADRLVEGDDALLDGNEACPRGDRLGNGGNAKLAVLVTAGVDGSIRTDHRCGHVLDGPRIDQVERLHGVSGETGAAQHVGYLKRQIEALAGIQPWVADCLIAVVELAVEDLVGTADALGDVVAGELDMDSAGPCALGACGARRSL